MRRAVLLGAIAWVFLSASFGQILNCPSATSVQSGVTVPGAGPGNDLAGNTQDCLWIDKIFSNFSSQPGLASTNDIYFFAAPFDNTLDPVANPVFVTFATVRGDGSGGDASDLDGVNNFSGGAGNGSLQYLAQVSGGTTNAIDQIGLTFNLTNIPSLDQLGFTLMVCLDGSSLPVTFDAAGCIAAGGSGLQSMTYNFSGPFSGTLHQDFVLSHPVTSLALNNVFDFGTSSSFLTFSQEFVDPTAPEPSTFVLGGWGLAGAGFLRYRRKR